MHIDIPDGEAWAAVGTVVLISATQFIRFIRWQKDVLTVKAHEKICGIRQIATDASFATVTDALKKQDAESATWRSSFDRKMDKNHDQNRGDIGEIKDTVGAVKTDLAVLTERVNNLQPGTTVNIQGGA